MSNSYRKPQTSKKKRNDGPKFGKKRQITEKKPKNRKWGDDV